jgi:hypothetical protein
VQGNDKEAETMTELRSNAARVGLHFDTYSPGDGVTRYRFFLQPTDYFAGNGIYTALGKKEAETFVAGFVLGVHYTKEAETK